VLLGNVDIGCKDFLRILKRDPERIICMLKSIIKSPAPLIVQVFNVSLELDSDCLHNLVHLLGHFVMLQGL
jgi:hypothetical protein